MNTSNLSKEQKTFREMLTLLKSKNDKRDLDKLLAWNEEIERTEEVHEGHSIRVAYLAKRVGEMLNLTEDELTSLYFASLFHDIGKHLVPKEILGKKGRLTDEEFDVIKKHCNYAEGLLNDILDKKIISIVKQHHERLNGSGYPAGIDLQDTEAKILGIIDSYDAMTSKRVYNTPQSKLEALRELELCTKRVEEGGKGELYEKKYVDILKKIVLEEDDNNSQDY